MDYHPDVYKANFIDFIKRNDGKEDEDDKDKSQLWFWTWINILKSSLIFTFTIFLLYIAIIHIILL